MVQKNMAEVDRFDYFRVRPCRKAWTRCSISSMLLFLTGLVSSEVLYATGRRSDNARLLHPMARHLARSICLRAVERTVHVSPPRRTAAMIVRVEIYDEISLSATTEIKLRTLNTMLTRPIANANESVPVASVTVTLMVISPR